ncbi:E3 ubiquitin-protein ligase RNF14-like [Haliotis rubra]|uniref:E3 ubiquitin-protein ligase RNF14-like n=1 Tax=Haliotis rubra TaxID=36100 RepID=UPI001EE56272|nr:E3 ubiquitin-protein ligase RNF14-like [Haliotis rubra]
MAEGGVHESNHYDNFSQENFQEQSDEVLALQSIYDGSDINRIEVLSSPTDGDGEFFVLHISVPVQTDGQLVTVNFVVTDDGVKQNAAAGEVTPPCVGKDVQLETTGDGAWTASFNVKYLPPLSLQVVLPATYPSQSSPVFTLSCVWLTANQLAALCGQLDELWRESENLPVIFTWVDWLENNIFSFLELGSNLDVPLGEVNNDESRIEINTDFHQAINTMIQYNRTLDNAEFRRSNHECLVCFEEFPGSQFYRLGDCLHHTCRRCMEAYCHHHVSLGTVEELRCPATNCNVSVPPDIVQNVLPAEEFDRWERLLLQRALESMTDVDWCPRCNNPVIREEEDHLNLGHCTTCFFSFCTLCRDPWHQGDVCMTIEQKLQTVNRKELLSSAGERRHFEEKRRKLEEEIRTKTRLHRKTRLCPKCSAKIEKAGGCNKMKCRCGISFCWLCGLVINSYRHYMVGNSRCSLMDMTELTPLVGTITPQNVEYVQALVGAKIRETISCPNCRYKNVKVDRNNHIRCRCCSTNFCYVCGMRITGVVTAHFSKASCPQHS